MKTVTFTEFRKAASGYLSEVENGEKLILLRHGKAIAEIIPPSSDARALPSWKRPALRLKIKGKSLSNAILEEREESD